MSVLSEDGTKVYIQAISLLELQKVEEGITAEYKAKGEPIDPPTYEVTTAGGGKIKLPMNETNLEVEGNPQESAKRQLDWQMHQDALARMKNEIGSISTEIIMEGVLCDPPSEEWIAKKRKRHIIIPEDPDERLLYYKMTEILRTPGDIVKAQSEIMLLSSSGAVKREDIEAAGAMFLRQIRLAAERPAGEVVEAGGNGKKAAEEPLVAQPDAKRTRHRKRVGDTAQ